MFRIWNPVDLKASADFKSWLYHIKAMQLCRNDLSNLCLNFLVYEMGTEQSPSLGSWTVIKQDDRCNQPTSVSNEQYFALNSTVLARIKDKA